jgi:hypothetical protein
MSTTKIVVEREIEKLETLIQRANVDIRDAQLHINGKNKAIEAWTNQKAALLADLEKLNG